jgi:DNA-binding response OmpR family regulator
MATTGRIIRILVAGDNPDICRLLIKMLQYLGHYVEACSGGQEALECLKTTRYTLLVLDNGMPRKTGCEIIQTLRSQGDSIPVVLITSMVRERIRKLCDGLKNVQILSRPFSFFELRTAINASIRSASAESTHIA